MLPVTLMRYRPHFDHKYFDSSGSRPTPSKPMNSGTVDAIMIQKRMFLRFRESQPTERNQMTHSALRGTVPSTRVCRPKSITKNQLRIGNIAKET